MNAHEWTAVLALSFVAGCSSADDSGAATGNGNNDEHGTPDAATMEQKSGPDSGFDTAKDAHAEMSPAVARARVARVAMAFVLDIERDRRERRGQSTADRFDALAHGRTLRNGCTRTSRKTPAPT